MCSSQAVTVIVLGLSASLLLGACGKDDPEGAASASPSAPASSASSTPSASPSATPTPPKPVKPSSDLDEIKVSGDMGKAPKVTIDDPWVVDKTRSKVIEANEKGPTVKAGQSVEMNYAGYNARTGEMFDDSFSKGDDGHVQPGPGGSGIPEGPGRTARGEPGAGCHARVRRV